MPNHTLLTELRRALRQTLLAQREEFATLPEHAACFATAKHALSAHLHAVLQEIEPDTLGLYWPTRFEFDPISPCLADENFALLPLALPFAAKAHGAVPPAMHYRSWNRQTPTEVDECGIPTPGGPPLRAAHAPDVLLVPCVGYTERGYRLGYGGGYFDRYLAAHPSATAIGLAFSHAELTEEQLQTQAHDLPLSFIITERGVVSSL